MLWTWTCHAAGETQVKGHFLWLLEQDVRPLLWLRHCEMPVDGASLLWLHRHQWYQGSTQMKNKHCSTTPSNTIRPLIELHGTCYNISNAITLAKANTETYICLIHWWHCHIMAKNSKLFHTSFAQFLHLIRITIKYVQYKDSKLNVGYYKRAM